MGFFRLTTRSFRGLLRVALTCHCYGVAYSYHCDQKIGRGGEPLSTKGDRVMTSQPSVRRFVVVVSLALLCFGLSADPARAQGFPPGGDDKSPSVGILTVEFELFPGGPLVCTGLANTSSM